jgi:hypothetical protein
MPDNPWRCSQCGTINEPVANSCRTCGKWPSLFDLEDNVVDEAELLEAEPTGAREPETHDAPEPVTVEVETFEPDTFEPEPVVVEESTPSIPSQRRRMFDPPTTKPVLEGEETRRARWISWLVPIAFVVYIAISYAFSGR